MEQAVAEFSRGLLALMIALFYLQAALITDYSHSDQMCLIEAFQQSREALRADWGKYVILFKGCRAYAEEYMTLCQYSTMHRNSEALAVASDLPDKAKELSREIRILQSIYGKACADLEEQIQRLPLEFRQLDSRMPAGL